MVQDAPERSRFEATVDGELAGFAAYRLRDQRLVFTHTEVLPAYEGRGVGGALARSGLDSVRARGLRAVPVCPFIAGWLDKHPGVYDDLLGE